jgi:predicted nucleic acid-binding protein
LSDKVIIDTNVAIYLAKGSQKWAPVFRPLLEGKEIAIAFATAAELLLTSRRSADPARNISYWQEQFKLLQILTPDLETCVVWASVTARLKNSGLTRQDNDLWVAACAVRHGLPLITNNKKDFTGIPELKFLDP